MNGQMLRVAGGTIQSDANRAGDVFGAGVDVKTMSLAIASGICYRSTTVSIIDRDTNSLSPPTTFPGREGEQRKKDDAPPEDQPYR